jgi:hypothetical protein
VSDLGKTFDDVLDDLSPKNEPYQGDPADPLKVSASGLQDTISLQ